MAETITSAGIRDQVSRDVLCDVNDVEDRACFMPFWVHNCQSAFLSILARDKELKSDLVYVLNFAIKRCFVYHIK